MTNKEAIERLLYIKHKLVSEEHGKALDLAIKALEQIDLIKFNIHALNKLIEEAENE